MPYDIEKIMQLKDEAPELERQKAADQDAVGQVRQIPTESLVDFPEEKHRFKPATGQRLHDLEESIRQFGIINPLVVRPLPDGRYQIITGHNRRTAARNIGYQTVPCIVRDLADDDEALGVLVSDNLQNRDLLPSERGWGYRDLMELRKRRGQRTDLTFGKSGQKSDPINSRAELAAENNTSPRNLQRYIRLTYLIPPLLDLADQGKLGLGAGEQLSYLRRHSQETVYSYCYAGEKPKPLEESQARALREVEADPSRIIDEDLLEDLLTPKKKVRFRTLKLEMAKLREYFPTGTPEEVVVQTIHTALAIYFEEKKEA